MSTQRTTSRIDRLRSLVLFVALFGAFSVEAAPQTRTVQNLSGAHASLKAKLEQLGYHPKLADRAAEHLLLGMPSPADRQNPNDYLLVRNGYVLSYNRDRNGLNWASWKLTKEDLGTVDRLENFRPDPTLPSDWYRPTNSDYKGNGFSRGHMVRSGERSNTSRANSKTFVFSNMLPQAVNNNTGPWNGFENYYSDRVQLDGKEAHVLAGGIFEGPRVGRVAIPSATWKIVTLLKPGQTVEQIDDNTRVVAVIIPNNNQDVKVKDLWERYRVSVREIAKHTGLKFFESLPAPLAARLLDRVDSEVIPPPPLQPWQIARRRERAALPIISSGVSGTVKMFDAQHGFGFIARPGERDVFVHSTNIRGGQALTPGQRVTFDVVREAKGPAARNLNAN